MGCYYGCFLGLGAIDIKYAATFAYKWPLWEKYRAPKAWGATLVVMSSQSLTLDIGGHTLKWASYWCDMSWGVKSLATWVFVQQHVQVNKKENTKATHYCPSMRRIQPSWVDFPDKGTVMWKVFPWHHIVMWKVIMMPTLSSVATLAHLNPLCAKLFRGNIKHIFTFHVIPLHWYDSGGWNPSSNKTRTYPFYIVNIMAAGVLATQGARTSVAMILT